MTALMTQDRLGRQVKRKSLLSAAMTVLMCVGLATATGGSATAQPVGDGQETVIDILNEFAREGRPLVSGDLDSPEGQRLLAAAERDDAAVARGEVPQATPPSAQAREILPGFPYVGVCDGATQLVAAAKANVDQVSTGLIWRVQLLPYTGNAGISTMSAQLHIDGARINGWQPHSDPWYRPQHGSIQLAFQKVGGGTGYIKTNSLFQGLWYWRTEKGGGYIAGACSYTLASPYGVNEE